VRGFHPFLFFNLIVTVSAMTIFSFIKRGCWDTTSISFDAVKTQEDIQVEGLGSYSLDGSDQDFQYKDNQCVTCLFTSTMEPVVISCAFQKRLKFSKQN